jgi:hypothetical protein
MTRGFDEALEACLELIRSGQESIDGLLSRYPEFAEELRPQLEAAQWLYGHKSAVEPRPGFVKASRSRLVERIRQEKQQAPLTWRERLQQRLPVQRVAPIAFVAILMLSLFVSGTVVSASQRALPGERLYGVKRTLEGLALATSLDEANDAELQIRFVEERLSEFRALIADERYPEATATLIEYEQQLNQAFASLENLKERDFNRFKLLAKQLGLITADYQSIFASMTNTIPPSFGQALRQAIRISNNAEEKTQVFADLAPPTPTPVYYSPTPLPPTATPPRTPRATPTLPPTQPVEPTAEPTDAPTRPPKPTATPTPVPPTKVPTNTPPPPTDVPRPTPTIPPTDIPTPEPTDTPTKEPTPTNTPVTPTDEPTPTDTPVTPTDEPTPTDTPEPPSDTPVPTEAPLDTSTPPATDVPALTPIQPPDMIVPTPTDSTPVPY